MGGRRTLYTGLGRFLPGWGLARAYRRGRTQSLTRLGAGDAAARDGAVAACLDRGRRSGRRKAALRVDCSQGARARTCGGECIGGTAGPRTFAPTAYLL